MSQTVAYLTAGIQREFVKSVLSKYKISEVDCTNTFLSLAIDEFDGGLHYLPHYRYPNSYFLKTIGDQSLKKVVVVANHIYFLTRNNLVLTISVPKFRQEASLRHNGDNLSADFLKNLADEDSMYKEQLQNVIDISRTEHGVFVQTKNNLLLVRASFFSEITFEAVHTEDNEIIVSAAVKNYQVIATKSAIKFMGDNSRRIVPELHDQVLGMTIVDAWKSLVGNVTQIVPLENHVLFLDSFYNVRVSGQDKLCNIDVPTFDLRKMDIPDVVSISAHSESRHVQVEARHDLFVIGNSKLVGSTTKSGTHRISKNNKPTSFVYIYTSNDTEPSDSNGLAIIYPNTEPSSIQSRENEYNRLSLIRDQMKKAMERIREIERMPLDQFSEITRAEARLDYEDFKKNLFK